MFHVASAGIIFAADDVCAARRNRRAFNKILFIISRPIRAFVLDRPAPKADALVSRVLQNNEFVVSRDPACLNLSDCWVQRIRRSGIGEKNYDGDRHEDVFHIPPFSRDMLFACSKLSAVYNREHKN